MAQLVQSFAGDTAIRLQNEEIVRQMYWGTNWHKLRIAIHHAIPQATGAISANIYIGVCQGNTNTYKSSTTTDWVGGTVGSAAWTYVSGPPDGVTSTGANPNGAKRTGNSTTTTAGSVANNYLGVTNRDFWIFEITKTATGFNLGTRTPTSVPSVDLTPGNFAMYAAQESAAPGLVTSTIAVSYAGNYLWDNISIYWDYASVGYEISEILAIRLA